jgi:hypothetical protein
MGEEGFRSSGYPYVVLTRSNYDRANIPPNHFAQCRVVLLPAFFPMWLNLLHTINDLSLSLPIFTPLIAYS